MPRIAPDEMRCFPVRIDDVNIRSVGIVGEHSRAETAQARCPPAMLEVNLHPNRESAGRVELQFVVVAEPVEFRALCDSPDRRQARRFRFPIFDFRFGRAPKD